MAIAFQLIVNFGADEPQLERPTTWSSPPSSPI
jgi:hypothetical protein